MNISYDPRAQGPRLSPEQAPMPKAQRAFRAPVLEVGIVFVVVSILAYLVTGAA